MIGRRAQIGWLLSLLLSLPAAANALAGSCLECDGDGTLETTEVSLAVETALGAIGVASCATLDADGSDSLTVDEIVAAIARSARGCSAPTPTPPPSPSPTPTPSPGPDPQLPPTDAALLLSWLEAGSYLDWRAESAPHPSAGPHFGTIRTFINDRLFDSLTAGAAQHPQGAAAVKELYGPTGTTVRGWAVMTKISADSAGGAGWYWYEGFNGPGSGGVGVPLCTGCHSLGSDFIRIPFPLQ